MAKENPMKNKPANVALKIVVAGLAIVTCGAASRIARAQAQAQPPAQQQSQPKPSPSTFAPDGKGFATPKEAADALIQAASVYNVPSLLQILGKSGKDVVASKDTVQDKNRASGFVAK